MLRLAVGAALPGGVLAVRPPAAASPAAPPESRPERSASPVGLKSHQLALGSSARRSALLLEPPATESAKPSRHLLLLLHGRGEARDPELGRRAWRDLYGLADAYARLAAPPIRETSGFVRPERLERLNRSLADAPFAAPCSVCPVTPNPHASSHPEALLDEYANWIESDLLPAARRALGEPAETRVGLDGCSMGGLVAAEVFLRKPHLFHTFGMVQPAMGEFRVARYARRMQAAKRARPELGLHLQTSTRDAYRGVVARLSRELRRLHTDHVHDELPGPHGQSWLRAAGTLVMLRWHERALSGAGSSSPGSLELPGPPQP